MSAEIVLEHYLNKFGTLTNTISDISFENLPFLVEKEPLYNLKGQKVSKSYYCEKGKEAVRIMYERVIEDFIYNGVKLPNIFTGLQKRILYFDWQGKVVFMKTKNVYSFDLQPVFSADGTEIIGFSSQKQRSILKGERYQANDYLANRYPVFYASLLEKYKTTYANYLKTGKSAEFKAALNSETDPVIIEALSKEVTDSEYTTFKELIIASLQ